MEFGLPQLTIGCESCGAALQVARNERTAVCPYCTSPSVVERPPAPDRPTPLFGVGFVLPRDDAVRRVRLWIRSRGVFTHSAFKRAPVENTRGVYLPAYLYGAVARADYRAEIGENYTVTETVRRNGKTSVRTKVKTEWRTLAGRYACYVRDVIVTASRGIPNTELDAIEPFDLRALKRYSSALISGWISEEPSITLSDCYELARAEARTHVGGRIARFMPGDKHRNLEAAVQLDEEVLELLLLPVWVFAVKYHEEKPPVRILVNGQTGSVAGKPPLSALKIVLAVLAALAVIGGAVLSVWLAGQG